MSQKIAHAALLVLLIAGLLVGSYAPASAQIIITPPATPTADYGDAPDSTNSAGAPMSAYPGVQAQFPTVVQAAVAPAGPFHKNASVPYVLGRGISAEAGADAGADKDIVNNLAPQLNNADRDGRDDGFVPPMELAHCAPVQFRVAVTAFDLGQQFPQRAIVNLWIDSNRSGAWGEMQTCSGGALASEWTVQNQIVSLPGPGTHVITLPAAVVWNQTGGDQWIRVTLSDAQAHGPDGSGPVGGYALGETEDYLSESVRVTPPTATLPPLQPSDLVADVPLPIIHLPLVSVPPPAIPPGPDGKAAPSGTIQEIDMAHIGGTGPAKPLIVTVAGTGSTGRLASWTVTTQNAAPALLQDGPNLIGYNHQLHVLTPDVAAKNGHNMMVSGLIRDDTLWLTTWRVQTDGTFVQLDQRGYGPNAEVAPYAYAMAHRPLVVNADQKRYQLVTPILHNAGFLRMVTWEINGITGAISGKSDSGNVNAGASLSSDLAASFAPGDGGFVVPHYNVSLRTAGDTLVNLFWDVTAAGLPTLRGQNSSGLNIRGTGLNDNPALPANNAMSLSASNLDIAPLADEGFLSAVVLPGGQLRLHSWENLVTGCDGTGCQYAPSNISDNSQDLAPGNGIQQPLPSITSQRAMLRDPLYQDDIWSQNADVVQAIASVRKVMVAIVALEREDDGFVSMSDDVTISADAAAVVGSGASNMGLVEGEIISLGDLMYGNLMVSAGDATWAISEEAGGTVEGMVDLMNAKVAELGLANTTYCTEGPGQGFSSVGYSTARDQALLWESVYDDPEFLEYAGQTSADVCGTVDGEMLCHPAIPPMTRDMSVYPGLDGHKNGGGGGLCTSQSQFDAIPTCPSGGCLSSQATRLGRPLIVSVLQPSGQTPNRWPDTRTLYDYGFRQFFTPDFRGTSGNQGGAAADFGIDYLSDSHGLSAAITGGQTITLCNWNMSVGTGAINKAACANHAVNGLASSTRTVPPTTLDLVRVSTLEADGDYLLGSREGGNLVMRIWRVGEHD